jgi:hypothetical protein
MFKSVIINYDLIFNNYLCKVFHPQEVFAPFIRSRVVCRLIVAVALARDGNGGAKLPA